MYRNDLERLMTLSADDIDDACRCVRIDSLITRCFDEHLELADLADEAAEAGDLDAHGYYAQEGAAWRATAQLLSRLGAAGPSRRVRGVA